MTTPTPDLLKDNELTFFPADTGKLAQATNGNATVTLAAEAGKIWAMGLVTVGYSDTPTGGLLTIFDGANPIFRVPITQSNPTPVPVYRYGGAGNQMSATLSAGGSGIVGYINVEAVKV